MTGCSAAFVSAFQHRSPDTEHAAFQVHQHPLHSARVPSRCDVRPLSHPIPYYAQTSYSHALYILYKKIKAEERLGAVKVGLHSPADLKKVDRHRSSTMTIMDLLPSSLQRMVTMALHQAMVPPQAMYNNHLHVMSYAILDCLSCDLAVFVLIDASLKPHTAWTSRS